LSSKDCTREVNAARRSKTFSEPISRNAGAPQRGADFSNLRVEKVDIENDDIDGRYDPLFFMDTLDYIHGRRRLASVCDKLIRIVRPGESCVLWMPTMGRLFCATPGGSVGFPKVRTSISRCWPTIAVLRLVQRRRFHGNTDPPDPGYEDHLSAIFQKCAS
jgi:hypothetical protein